MQDQEVIEHDFELVDLVETYKKSTLKQAIKENDSQIRELVENLARARFIISFLEWENNKLKAKQLIMEKEKAKMLQQEVKVKEVLYHDEHDEKEN